MARFFCIRTEAQKVLASSWQVYGKPLCRTRIVSSSIVVRQFFDSCSIIYRRTIEEITDKYRTTDDGIWTLPARWQGSYTMQALAIVGSAPNAITIVQKLLKTEGLFVQKQRQNCFSKVKNNARFLLCKVKNCAFDGYLCRCRHFARNLFRLSDWHGA